MKKFIYIALLTVSLLGNLLFGLDFYIRSSSAPVGNLGVLKEDIPIGSFSSDPEFLFMLPKGLVVKDSSPRSLAAIGLFERNRFIIEITSDRLLVDFNQETTHSHFGEIYSADNLYSYQTQGYKNETDL